VSLEPRIRLRACAFLAFLPVLLLLVQTGETRCESIRGEGEFEFYVDIASLPAGDRGALQLLQIAVPTKGLRYIEKTGTYTAEVRFTVSIQSKDAVVHKKTFQLKDTRDAMPQVRDLSAFLYVIDSCSVDPGRYRLTVKVEDLQRRKRTLLGIIHRSYVTSMVKDAAIEIQEFPPNALALADPILIWGFDPNGRFIPNPMQIYGLRKDTLSVYVQATLPEPVIADSLTVRLVLNRETGETMGDELFKVPVRGNRGAFLKAVDLSTYSAGSYRVAVEVRTDDGLYAVTGKDFNVAWELLNWQKPMRDILVEARILLRNKEFSEFEQMTLGEQEEYMKSFWKKLDPTPQTAANETYSKFTARVRYADEHFGDFTRGALTDRGFVYIRLGPPDEIINKSLPHNREELYEGIDKIMTDYKIIDDSYSSYSSPKQVKDVRPLIISPEKQRATRGLVGSDVGSFEVWGYNIKGDPILIDDKGMTVAQGIRFLFLDKDGIGTYRLVGSSEDMTKGGPE
jgi:GWxTD domain-containing protein